METMQLETVGLGFCVEDMPVGRKFQTIGRTITETDIVNFVSTTGMLEVLFTNMEYLERESVVKGRISPGSLVFCIIEGLLVQATIQGTGFAFIDMNLKMHAPTFAGDTVHAECEVIESRLSKSRPGTGLVRTRNRVYKQDGTLVMEYDPLRMMKSRAGRAA